MSSSAFLVALLVGSCSAFAPATGMRPAVARSAARPALAAPVMELQTEDMWWGDQDYPPSKVLGIGKNVPSGLLGVSSGIALTLGLYCIAQSNLLNILSGSTVNGFYVAGALLVPYSWGLHVASWIQKQNGK